jgi:alcohol dehydrogenase class IV
VLDLGKAVAVLLGNGTDPMDHLEVVGRGRARRAAGPAVCRGADDGGHRGGGDRQRRAQLPGARRQGEHPRPHLLAAVALVDPLLTLSCPPAVTASSGLDALTQCLEPYVSPRANPATDAVAAEGLRRGARALRTAYEHGEDRAAREEMALCSLFGGIALANAKLGAVHGVAGVVGGMVDAPHGAVCAALLAPVVEDQRAGAARARAGRSGAAPLRRGGRLLTGRDGATVGDAVAWLRGTVAALDVPPLGAVGLRRAQYAEVATKAARSSSMQGNPVRLTEEELVTVLHAAS